MTDDEKAIAELEKQRKENYRRLLFAIAIYFSKDLKIDIKKQDSYEKLTPAQKTFAKKQYDAVPKFSDQVNAPERIAEQTIVEDVREVATSTGNAKKVRIVTVGDDRVCPKCEVWNGKIVSLDGSSHPSLDDAIDKGFLHYGCRCALQELTTVEIPLKEPNPRRDVRRAANPAAYNCILNGKSLVYN